MGFGLRFREKVKQVGSKSSQPDKHGFVPTSYERVQLTYDEAFKFAESLRVIRKSILQSNHARSRMLRDVEHTLIAPLPCIHEFDPVTGEHTTSEAAPEGAANYVHQGTLVRLSDEQDAKIQQQVLAPIDKWISEVENFKGKMKNLENLRLELDGSRRDHITLENKIAKAEAKSTEAPAKHTTHIQSKDASVAGKRTAFEQYEAQLYEELISVIGETGVLHTALDSALKLEIDTYQRALDPISSTTQRLENLSTSGVSSPVSGTPASSLAGGPAGGHPGGIKTGAPTGAPTGGYSQPASGGYSQPPSSGYSQPASGGYGQAPSSGYGQAPSGQAGAPAVPTTPASYEKPYAS